MLAAPTISVPDSAGRPDIPAISTPQEFSAPPRFPHTRAQLTAIARQYRPLDNYDDDNDDDSSRITSAFVARVAALLDGEREEELKMLLKDTFGSSIDDEDLSQHVLDLMHRQRDDVEGVPFLFLTPTRRPISRPSSRASTHSARLMGRPDTPNSAPSSPLAMVFRRPHTPLVSPLAAGQQGSSYMNPHGESPVPSPTIPHAQFTTSLPASPLSSPRILNAKAHEFKPIPRPLSAASSNPGSLATLRADTPSPDMWAHSSRPTSKLAIAAPLTPEGSLLPRASTPSSLRLSLQPDDEDEDDPFDPFAPKPLPRSFHHVDSELSHPWSNSSLSSSSLSTDDAQYNYYMNGEYAPSYSSHSLQDNEQYDMDVNPMLTDGMTPLDVLSSIFGSALAPSELEEALNSNGYDFDRAVTWLVDRQIATHHSISIVPPASMKVQAVGNRVSIVSRDGFPRGGRGGFSNRGQKFASRPVPGGNRVCRYFLAGECLRADCRFSHDLERALCRFWLRGTCAKGENCEFLHHLPKDVDVSTLTQAMARNTVNPANVEHDQSGVPEEFPALNQTMIQARNRRGGFARGRAEGVVHDPSRTRFATAVKRAPAPVAPAVPGQSSKDTRRDGSTENTSNSATIVAPRPSPRLKLRPPTLLPTLPTGEAVNKLYMAYRARAHQLGSERNTCLARAAEAWKRGDGAAAKRFSRDGHDLNAKMSAEMVQAAGRLVRERAKLAEQAVRTRDSGWSDDVGDRSARGSLIGAGLGVCLGIASQVVNDNKKATPEERTEVMLDLHGLHATEATEVVEEFLLAVEREHFYGLVFLIVGEEKHTGTQDPARGASRARLAAGVREWLHLWGYPWSERDGIICVDPLTHV